MSAQQLYDEIKDALKYFGIRFHQMDMMAVSVAPDEIRFTYQGRTLIVPVL